MKFHTVTTPHGSIPLNPPAVIDGPQLYQSRQGRMLVIDGEDRVAVYQLADDGQSYVLKGEISCTP